MNKRVLIIAYHFPPIASSGTFRSMKFAKYLPQFGWDPVVLTVDPKCETMEPKDNDLLKQVPKSIPVIRTYVWLPWKLLRRSHSPNKKIPAKAARLQKESPASLQPPRKQKSLGHCLKRFLFFPDRFNGWFPFAVIHGWQAVRRYKIDVIYSSAPPYTGTLVGLTLHWFTRKPLVSDFRDPWNENTYRGSEFKLFKKLIHFFEQTVFKNSSHIINVSEDLSDKARSRSYKGIKTKFVTITNGFDPEDFPKPSAFKDRNEFRITYAGCFYPPYREPRNFLLALAKLKKKQPLEFNHITAYFLGEPGWAKENAAWLYQQDLGEHIKFSEFKPHQETLKFLSESDVQLMLGSIKKADTGTLPAKIFEYLAIQKPILALVHEGESAKLIRASGIGVVADPENPEEIANTLLEMYHRIRTGRFPTSPNLEIVKQYDRRELTRQLAVIFDEVIESASHP